MNKFSFSDFETSAVVQAKVLNENNSFLGSDILSSSIQGEKDFVRQKFIEKQLPEYFGVKALGQQKSIIKGRHPQSFRKESELWHYTKASNERHERIKRGHSFWDVIHDSAVNNVNIEYTDKEKKVLDHHEPIVKKITQPVTNTHRPVVPSTGSTFMSQRHPNTAGSSSVTSSSIENSTHVPPSAPTHNMKGSIQTQLKNAMAKTSGDLNLKIDFHNRNIINYNMGFLIMNYNNEVLYYDKNTLEFHVKPFKELKPMDKAKFKFVDLNNPSNPRAIKFGENVWFHILPLSSDITNKEVIKEDTFQFGSCMTTQLYDPIEVKQVKYNAEYLASSLLHESKQSIEQHKRTMKAFLDPSKVSKEEKAKAVIEEINKENRRKIAAAGGGGGAGGQQGSGKDDEQDDFLSADGDTGPNSLSSTFRLPEEEREGGDNEDGEGGLSLLHQLSTASMLNETMSEDGDQQRRPNTAENVVKKLTRQEEYLNKLKVCGQLNMMRIIDPKKMDAIPDGLTMTNDKLTRYINKPTNHLGKFVIHSAVRLDDPNAVQEHFLKYLNNKNGGGAEAIENSLEEENDGLGNNNNNPNISIKDYIQSHLISLTPIIIQQDQYCLSTATPNEYTAWPPTSTYIINHSKNVQHELAEEYDQEYEQFLKTNASHIDLLQLPSIYGKTPKGSEVKLKQLNQISTKPKTSHGGQAGNKKGPHSNNNSSNNSHSNHPSTKKSGGNGNHPSNQTTNSNDFGCLRRIISRPAPYEFTVDRRSVWKLCLFEEFSNANAQSKKENEVKKIMETANMVLKLSKMNRDGAKIHIKENHIEKLPPLVSGEKFIPHLREIKLRQSFTKSFKSLEERRLNEVAIHDYFDERIHEVLEQEKIGFKKNLTSIRANKQLFSSKSTIEEVRRSLSRSPEHFHDEDHQHHHHQHHNQHHYHQHHDDDSSIVSEISVLTPNLRANSKGHGVSFGQLPPPSRSNKTKKSYLEADFPHPDPSELFTLSSIDSKYYSVNSNDSLKEKKTMSYNPSTQKLSTNNNHSSAPLLLEPLNKKAGSLSVYSQGSHGQRSHHSHKVPYTKMKGKLERKFSRALIMSPNSSNTSLVSGFHQHQHHQHHQHHPGGGNSKNPPPTDTGSRRSTTVGSPAGMGIGIGGDYPDDVSLLSMGSVGSGESLQFSRPPTKGDGVVTPGGGGGGEEESFGGLNFSGKKTVRHPRSHHHHITRNHFSEEIKKVFNTNIVPPLEKNLLLVNSEAVHDFPTFSEGEQLLSYHKTMNYLTKVAKAQTDQPAQQQQQSFTRQRTIPPGIMNKLAALEREDEQITKIITMKHEAKQRAEALSSGI